MNTPSLEELKTWLGLEPEDTADDSVLQGSLDAALQAQSLAVLYPSDAFGQPVFTPDLEVAAFLRAVRIAARRNSPESVVGITGLDGDFVGARIPAGDPDVARLEAPYTRIVSA
jgi:hypothetical protein